MFRIHSAVIAVIIITVELCAIPVSAKNRTHGDAGLHFTIASPSGEFRDSVDRNGYGVSGYGAYTVGKSPLKIGLEMGYIMYGHNTRTEPISLTIPDVTVNVQTTNNIFNGHLLFRVQEQYGSVAPYIDGLLGFNYFWTSTTIENESNYEEIASSTNLDDAVFSYGLGGGIMVQAGRVKAGRDRLPLYIDLKVRYLLGDEADYLKEGSITHDLGTVSYDISTSKTDMMLYQIGVAIAF